MEPIKGKMILVFFEDEKADEFERRAAAQAEEGEEVEYHAGEEVPAGGDSSLKDRAAIDQ